MKRAVVLKFPNIKICRRGQRIREEAEIWYDRGFDWESSVVAATMYLTIERLERRIKRLEGKKLKNSPRRKSKRIQDNVVLFCK